MGLRGEGEEEDEDQQCQEQQQQQRDEIGRKELMYMRRKKKCV